MKARRFAILIVLAVLFLAAPGFIRSVAASPSASVLILNSYHQGYSWTDGEVAGIRSAIADSGVPAQLSAEYLDWRRFPTQQNEAQIEALLTLRYGTVKPGVLVVTDNPALEFALNHRSDLFAGVPIVFCGINDFQPTILRGMNNITGVAEEIDPASTIALALRLHSRATSMYVITDFTETGLAIRRTIQGVVQQFQDRATFTFSPDVTLQELMDAVTALPRNTIILAAPFTSDQAGVFTDIPEFTAQLAAHTNLPVYGIYEEGLGQGIVGGVLTSPNLEGEKAGQLAVRILAGESADSIPVVTRQSTRAAFDWRKLQQYGIPVSSLPAGAVIVNEPISILDTNRNLVIITAVVILLLVLGIVFLGITNIRRERAEAQVLRLATVVEQAAEAIVITDPDGLVTYVNPAFEHITGFSAPETKAKNIRDLLGEDVALPPEPKAQNTEQASVGWKRKVSTTRKDESPLELDLTVRPVHGPADMLTNYTFVGRDITEEAALEDQLRQSQKLEGIGLLAGGVAHDFNNILTGILGYANMLEPDAAPGSTMQEGLHVIQQAAERAAELTRQLLSFARRGKRQNTTVDLNSTILEVVSLLTRTVNKNITVAEHFDTNQATVLGDPSQLQQVVLNLSINGRDAMPEGGRLTFRTWRQVLDSEQLLPHPGAEPGVFVSLSVSDTGVGIEKKNLRRIFEPFFTTKDAAKGTGMGLAMVYGIVKAHHGFIDVQSESGHGTTFTVCIPATDMTIATQHSAESPRSGHGRILVVDDEEVVRKLAREMLRRAGYDVVAVSGLEEAVEWYRTHPHQADLVIIDMVMPGRDGEDCFNALKAIDPGIRAILSTGYGLDGHAQDALDAGMVGYVQKPYHMQDLITAVADALAENPPD
ncbi:MAG: hybrid sensor histidine kinase/response regulator [Candidatus Cryosericum sp.]